VLREVAAFFADPPAPLAVFETTDADHGRNETRRHRVSHDIGWLFSDRRHRLRRCDPHRGRQDNPLDPLLPELGEACPRDLRPRCPRPPGDREQPATSVLDVPFDEDRARNRRDSGAENLAILRRLTLNRLNKARPGMSLARKRNRSGCSDAFARTIIGQMR
jgi:hypothetical protein